MILLQMKGGIIVVKVRRRVSDSKLKTLEGSKPIVKIPPIGQDLLDRNKEVLELLRSNPSPQKCRLVFGIGFFKCD